MNKENVLEEFRVAVGIDSAKARGLIKVLDFKQDYYLLQCIAQTYLDESRFEDAGYNVLRTRFDRRKWRMAEKYIIKAYKINPDCAEVLYTMGEIRKLYNQLDIAIYCFEKIVTLDIKAIAYGEYGRGLPFAEELINDSKFELYRLHYINNPDLSKKYLVMYLKGLQNGIKTIFTPIDNFLLK